MDKPLVMCVVGTRPDAIKSAPYILELKKNAQHADTVVVSTGQHREMLDQVFASFDFQPDVDLQLMRHGQTLGELSARALEGIANTIDEHKPSYILAQGDTTTTFIASLAAFYSRVPFGHVEAGLRTETIDNPFPEEFNRRATGLIATDHFAPTKWAAKNLISEGKDPNAIYITGNTGIDAVRWIASRPGEGWYEGRTERLVLLTTHRRENWGEPQGNIARAARRLIDECPGTLLVVPMHKNPDVRHTLTSILGVHSRIDLIEPPEYERFVKLMNRSALILTDSGGVQEEAPAFGVPVLVLRETTERPEGVEAGTAKLVGTDPEAIYAEGLRLLTDSNAYAAMSNAVSPYGDAQAARRIVSVVLNRLGAPVSKVQMWD